MKTPTSISDLTPLPVNPRKRTKRSHEAIVRSLEEFGAARSIVVDEDGVVLAGNGTLEAAAQLGIERVRVVETDGSELVVVRRTNLTADQKKRYAIADNRSSDLSEWDGASLVAMAEEVDLTHFFDPEELSPILEEAVIQMEEAQKPPRQARTAVCPNCGCEFNP